MSLDIDENCLLSRGIHKIQLRATPPARQWFSFCEQGPGSGRQHCKYVYWADGRNDFYDLDEDPGERRNLALHSQCAAGLAKYPTRGRFTRQTPLRTRLFCFFPGSFCGFDFTAGCQGVLTMMGIGVSARNPTLPLQIARSDARIPPEQDHQSKAFPCLTR